MVRTKHIGHIRDVRRLIVAMSRARLGLYVFGRQSLFSKCSELKPTFSQLLSRPVKLHILPNEKYPTNRSVSEQCSGATEINNMNELIEVNKRLAVAANIIPRT